MSDEEARGVPGAEFNLQAARYPDLVKRLGGAVAATEGRGLSGATYHVELQGFGDDDEHRALRVMPSIDDGGACAFLPFTHSFTITLDGMVSEHSTA